MENYIRVDYEKLNNLAVKLLKICPFIPEDRKNILLENYKTYYNVGKYKKAVIICCDNKYIPKAIVALELFYSYNKDCKKIIICTRHDNNMELLCASFNIMVKEVDLNNKFIGIKNQKYPIECFYHFYVYKLLPEYDYIIQIEPDIYTNKKLNIDFENIKYIGCNFSKTMLIKNFYPIMKDYNKIKNEFGDGNINQYKQNSGVKIYNVKGLSNINFYEKIVYYYNKSIEIGAKRMGDDSLFTLYQIYNEKYIKMFNPEFHIIYYNEIKNYKDITFFHFGGPNQKYWKINKNSNLNLTQKYFYNKMIKFINNNFEDKFINENHIL